jgi:1-acyl-sn-glycerol-3-phosphate acyltransferase
MTALRHLRSLLFTIPLCLLATAFLMFGGLLTATEDGVQMQRALFKRWARWILWICRLRVRVHGLNALQTGRAYIFASNHASLLDAPVLIAAIPDDLCFLVKYRFIPVLELFLFRTGQFAVRRTNDAEARRSIQEAAANLSTESRSLVVFPEGGRSESGLADFRDDAAFLALSSMRRLVPVWLRGTQTALPKNSTLIRGGTVDVYLGEPISTNGLDPRTATNNLRDGIEALAHTP